MTHNRLSILCLVLVAVMVSTFIATQLSRGQAAQTDNTPLKIRVLRKKAHVKSSPGQLEIAAFMKTVAQENERRLEDTIPKHVPIKVKIKKEKEAGFKNLNNERWAREFELEVTNTGTKPIYNLYLSVWTDVTAAAGFRIQFPLYYGRKEFSDIGTRPEPTDIPINPGESISLKIHPSQLDAWDLARKRENRPFPKRLKVIFQFVSFGDGTAYAAPDGQSLPSNIPDEGDVADCIPSERTDPFGWKEAPPGSPLSKFMAFNLPVATWPVNFFAGANSETIAFSSSLPQNCCTTNCSTLRVTQDEVCINCPRQDRAGIAICSDPHKICGTTASGYIECLIPDSNETYYCQTLEVTICSTTPSPSPSPTPVPCPLTLASQCPDGVPRDPCTYPGPPPLPGDDPDPNPDGCPFGYEVKGLCCVPIVCPSPTPTPPACPPGQASIFLGPPACKWSDCFVLPEPSSTPTPEPAQYKQECVDYYYVWFVSYDGGLTWQPTGQVEYAGCFYMS